MLRPMRPQPTRPSVDPARSRPSQRCSGQYPAFLGHGAGDGREALRQGDHQREGAFSDGLLGVFGYVDDRNVATHGRRDIDRVDADTVFDDASEPWRCVDDRGRHRRVAHEQKVGVGHCSAKIRLGDPVRK